MKEQSQLKLFCLAVSLLSLSFSAAAQDQVSPPEQVPATEPTPISTDTVVSFDYPDANIKDVISAISKLTGKNFIVDPGISGKISIISPSPVTVEEAYRAFLSALAVNRLSVVPSGKFFKVMRRPDAVTDSTQIFSGDFTPSTDNYVTRIIHLKHINAEDVRSSFRDLTTRDSQIIAYAPTNTIILTDTGANIAKFLDIIRLLDVPGFQERLEVIPLQFASAADLSTVLENIFQEEKGMAFPGARPVRRGGPSPFESRGGRGGGASVSRILPYDRTNSLIVLANEAGFARIKELLVKLDVEIKGAGAIHVYYLQNTNAEDISATLSALVQAAAPAGRPPTVRGGAFAVEELAAFRAEVKIQANKATNSLVITASPQDYETLKRVIEKLDIPRKQVFVEAYILEVRLNKTKNIGISYVGGAPVGRDGQIGSLAFGLSGGQTSIVDVLANPLALNKKGGILGFFSSGQAVFEQSDGKTVKIRTAAALIKALISNNQADLLSAPRILTLNNEEAEFKVGEKVPTLGSTSIVSANVSQQSIVDKDIFLLLKVHPQINEAGDTVRLKLEQAINAITTANVPSGLAGNTVGSTERTLKSTVVVKDKDTIVLGGLIKDDVEETEAKIPFLGDIPILGWLFKDYERKVVKNNILIFITPHIIHGPKEFRSIFDSNLKEREDFIQKFGFVGETKGDTLRKFNPPKGEE